MTVLELNDHTHHRGRISYRWKALLLSEWGCSLKEHPTWRPHAGNPQRAHGQTRIHQQPQGFPPPGFLLLWLAVCVFASIFCCFPVKSKPRNSPISALLSQTVVTVDMPGPGDRSTMIRTGWPLQRATGAGSNVRC